jgi:hypothetical protein
MAVSHELIRISQALLTDPARMAIVIAHELIGANGALPIAFEQLGIAVDEGFARHRDPVGPAMGFVPLDKIEEFDETSFQQLRHKRILYNGGIDFTGEERLPGFAQ